MPKIKSISSNKYLNSRAEWTVHTKVELEDGSVGIQAVPEGASKGEHEAVSLPAEQVVSIISDVISKALLSKEATDQRKIDEILIQLDGTPNKSKLGGNSILSVSLATASAAAKSNNLELYQYLRDLYQNDNPIRFPAPVFNIINGGKHANNDLSFQEFMIIPAWQMPFDKSMEVGAKIYIELEKHLLEKGFDVDVGDEGGFAPNNLTVMKALSLIREASSAISEVGVDVFFGLDVAAESFYRDGKYYIEEEKLILDSDQLSAYYSDLLNQFEIMYLEDPFYEGDHAAWKKFNRKMHEKVLIVADDLVVTNTKLLEKSMKDGEANAVIVKPNQVGTLTETLDFVKKAQENKLAIVVSHRSGDTPEDTFIADLALAVGADFIKSGAPARGERVAKYNRLLEVYYKLNG